MQKIKSILLKFKNKKVWIPSAIILLIIVVSMISSGGNSGASVVKVERGNVISEVSLTGKIKPSQSVDLAFEKSGRLQNIYVSLGQNVYEGQTLLELDNGDARSQVAQAQAQYQSQLAKLDEIKRGSTQEELDIKETILSNAYQSALDTLQDAYAKSEDAVRNQTAELFLYDEEPSSLVSFDSTDIDSKILAVQYRYKSGLYLNEFGKDVSLITANDTAKIDSLLKDAQIKIKYFLTLFSYLDSALNEAGGLLSATRSEYKSYISAGRSELNTALASVSSKEQAIANAQKELALKKSGSTSDAIAYQEAQVANAKASVQYAQSQLSKTIIRAPFAGMITKIPFNKGDIVQPQETAVSVIGTGAYQIETNVTESDISKISIGDMAKITLDAYSDDVVFEAKIVQIDLSETVIDGVPTYKTTLQLTKEDSRIISGMTANIDIISEQKNDVLYVSTRNIIANDGDKYIKKALEKNGEKYEEIKIETGLRGSDGRTEILSGLKEGDLIISE